MYYLIKVDNPTKQELKVGLFVNYPTMPFLIKVWLPSMPLLSPEQLDTLVSKMPLRKDSRTSEKPF
jgi:hypothetical protein